MCDFTKDAFDLADKYRIPVYVMTDAVIGQMMESVTLPEPITKHKIPQWALDGSVNDKTNVITSIYLDHDDLEEINIKLQNKYKLIEECEQQVEEYEIDDAEFIMVGYGIVSRVIRSAVKKLRQRGIKAGMIRPKTLFPFPKESLSRVVENIDAFVCVELSNGQMIDDIKLAIECKKPVHLINRMGGNIPSVDEVVEKCLEIFNQDKTVTS
jgi:pyruvate/2-oxoacid:ferredoxin oxidoreductase alpha subunit